jgi:hypothetical protein
MHSQRDDNGFFVCHHAACLVLLARCLHCPTASCNSDGSILLPMHRLLLKLLVSYNLHSQLEASGVLAVAVLAALLIWARLPANIKSCGGSACPERNKLW